LTEKFTKARRRGGNTLLFLLSPRFHFASFYFCFNFINALLQFFKRQLLIAHVSGIPVRVDYRWFFVLILMSWMTASSIDPSFDNIFYQFFFGFANDLIFFASIFLHEVAHAVAARMESVQVVEIRAASVRRFNALSARTGHAARRISHRYRRTGGEFSARVFVFGFDGGANSLGANIISPLFLRFVCWNFCWRFSICFPVIRSTAAEFSAHIYGGAARI
jgi:hypothetical protein